MILVDMSNSQGTYFHVMGNKECKEGFCGSFEHYPKPCECGGLIHAQEDGEDEEGSLVLTLICDKCLEHGD